MSSVKRKLDVKSLGEECQALRDLEKGPQNKGVGEKYDVPYRMYPIECRFTLKRGRDMIRTYSQIHRTDKYSQLSSIIWPVWLNGSVFVYELSGCRFESCCSHLNLRYRTCFEQGVP